MADINFPSPSPNVINLQFVQNPNNISISLQPDYFQHISLKIVDNYIKTQITPTEYRNTFKIAGIQNGKSAYETWVSLGNTGTEQDFINSLLVSLTWVEIQW